MIWPKYLTKMPKRDKILRSVTDIECWMLVARLGKKPLSQEELDKMEYPSLSDEEKQHFANEQVWLLLQDIRNILRKK